MFNENFLSDGKLAFKDQCPDIQGYRSLDFRKVPLRKQLPVPPPVTPPPPEDLKSKHFTILASDGFVFIIKKDCAIHCSQTIRWIILNTFWPEPDKNLLSFTHIHPYWMCYVCKYFNWAYYYGVRHFRKKPPRFNISVAEAQRLQLIANLFGC